MNGTLYKVLDKEGRPYHGGNGLWHLPESNNGWMPPIDGQLIPCERGYHLCRRNDLIHWLGPFIYEAEYRGELLESDDKVIVREARLIRILSTWNDRTARLFAADCAEHVLHIYEKSNSGNLAPREAIKTARLFAEGKATKEELAAAWAAAGDAAGAAVRAAAGDAAGAAVRAAAWDAAWDVAWDVARAAAGDAARDAAGDAAGDAAWDAEKAWQTERLFWYLEGEQ